MINLPQGWEMWPPDAKKRYLDTLRAGMADATRQPFYCPDPTCDGEPHGAWTERHARANQRPPVGWWTVWLILAGRGFGKTRTGAEWAVRMAKRFERGALVAPTAADVRDTMVEGRSGILAVAPASFRPKYEPSKRRLTYPNGAVQTTFSADEPERLRGPEHHYGWGDEWAAWRKIEDASDNLELGLRAGQDTRLLLTTTPKPRKRLREALEDPDTVVTRGSTYDNLVNLAPSFKRRILRKYEGTNLGRQELHAEVVVDVEGALWNGDILAAAHVAALVTEGTGEDERLRILDPLEIAEACARVAVAVDPAATNTESSDETGIVVTGVTSRNHCPACGPIADGPHGWVLGDVSGKFSPHGWAGRAVAAYERFQGDAVVGEVNNGGDMVGATVKTVSRRVRYRDVRASRGKQTRAEPVAALYEQGRVHHVPGLDQLEEQMRTWVPGEREDESPDRMDALVWGLTHLMLNERGGFASTG
jgi:phage terminase large subunit-like protein